MKISIEEKKKEAIARMKKLGISPEAVRKFEHDGDISISEPPFGEFHLAEGEDLQRIRDYEAQSNALVYAAVRSYTYLGKMDSYICVSDYPEDWPLERELLNEMKACAYVFNHDIPQYSECGVIILRRSIKDGLLRIW